MRNYFFPSSANEKLFFPFLTRDLKDIYIYIYIVGMKKVREMINENKDLNGFL
jgi:hypothetical protein